MPETWRTSNAIMDAVSCIQNDVMEELERAQVKFPVFHSQHEGYAVLLEEVEELKEAVFWKERGNARAEAVQVAAMAIRFLLDCPLPTVNES